ALFEAERFQRAVADGADIEGFACRHQRVKDAPDGIDRYMQFPAEFPDIGDAQRPDGMTLYVDLADMAEGEARVGDIRIRYGGEHIARPRPHQRERAEVLGDVAQRHVETGGNVVGDPAEIVRA